MISIPIIPQTVEQAVQRDALHARHTPLVVPADPVLVAEHDDLRLEIAEGRTGTHARLRSVRDDRTTIWLDVACLQWLFDHAPDAILALREHEQQQ